MYNKEDFFCTPDDARIHFESYGEGDPILLVPGFLCTTKFFQKNIEALSKNNRLILMDVRGHGASSKPLNNLTIPGLAQDIKDLVDFLGLENLTLMAWSLGSSIILSYYQQFGPYKLKGLGVVDSALYPFSHDPTNNHPLRGYNIDGMNDYIVNMQKDHEAFARSFAKVLFKNTPSKEDEDWVAKEVMKCPPYIAYTIYTDFLFRDYVSVLPTLDIPLLLCCADSPVLPQGVKMAKGYLPYVKTKHKFCIFENEGHMLFYENPDRFNQEVLDFVNNY